MIDPRIAAEVGKDVGPAVRLISKLLAKRLRLNDRIGNPAGENLVEAVFFFYKRLRRADRYKKANLNSPGAKKAHWRNLLPSDRTVPDGAEREVQFYQDPREPLSFTVKWRAMKHLRCGNRRMDRILNLLTGHRIKTILNPA